MHNVSLDRMYFIFIYWLFSKGTLLLSVLLVDGYKALKYREELSAWKYYLLWTIEHSFHVNTSHTDEYLYPAYRMKYNFVLS